MTGYHPEDGRPTVALISATPAAIGPATRAFAAEFPQADLLNLLDDGLQEQANRAGGLTPQLTERMRRLVDHAVTEGADGVLLTCSMYSSVAGLMRPDLGVPILGPDDAAFEAATAGAYRSIGLIASLPAALDDVQARLVALARQTHTPMEVHGTVAARAFDAVQAGDNDQLLATLEAAAAPIAGTVDALLLAQYSLTPVAADLETHLGVPVLSGPALAARTLRSAIAANVVA